MSLSTPAFWGAKLLARFFSSEGMLGLSGCVMACASGGFALYMNMNGPSAPATDSHYFTVFAQFSARAHQGKSEMAAPVVADRDEIDPVVTGSIPDRSERSPSGVNSAASDLAPQQKLVIPNMILRQIEGDSGLVEMNDSLSVYRVGDIIPGAGRLMGMTRDHGHAALQTSSGLIVEGNGLMMDGK
jgi:hypothetical protein